MRKKTLSWRLLNVWQRKRSSRHYSRLLNPVTSSEMLCLMTEDNVQNTLSFVPDNFQSILTPGSPGYIPLLFLDP